FIPEGPVTGSFSDKNVGVDKSVTLPGTPFSLAYNTVPVRGASLQYSADITPKFITAAGITADNKVYDATRTATLRGSLTGIIPGDDATLNGAAGLFDTKNVGIGKTVTIGGGSLAGADAGNYAFTPGSATTTADITPRPISTSGITAQDKVYDGNRVAAVSGSLSGAIAGDSVTLSGATGLFDTKNVGAGKAVSISGASLAGADAGNYVLSGPATTTAAITPKPVDISLGGAVSKEYDATTGASLASTQYALNGLVPSDLVSVKGPTQGSYDSPNVGTLKRVTATGAFEVTGADSPNYSIGGVALTNATSTVSTSVGGNVGAITPATLTYNADPAVRDFGAPLAGFTGNVSGFKGADSVGTATSGTPNWQTPATVASLPGTYAINGSGLSAGNYVFTQAPANASALTLRPNNLPDAPQQKVTQSSTAAIDAALGSVIAALNTRATIGGVFDISSPSAQKSFEAVDIASMSQDELAAMLEARRNFKRKLFADAIYKLEIDPSLADVRPCADAADVGSGLCRVTPAQIDEAQAKREKAQPAPKSVKTRNSSLPQIERKIAVLFGIDDYADTKIPRLENSIPDVEAVSKLFSEKLGYEIRVVRNPTKADIIRTLNQLSTEINSSDSVVIYYAGHGYSLEKNGAGYWLPSDASVSDPAGWISNSDVAKLLAGIRSRQMAVISDSCYSGAFAREGMGSVGRGVTADEVLTKRSVVVLSSGGDEPVADEGKEGHSIFAWNLMKAVNTVENWRPGSTIFTEVQVGVKKEFPQTPKYGSVTSAGHQQGGDYLFELR
ncbi:MAG: hypothetical protein JWQ33_1268, partial [Ramlibacter sp.]|nr:hypothetical protein [Ramlibacter sp.]